MEVKVVDSFGVPASTVTVLFQQKQANHENVAISKLSQIYFVIANNDNWLLTAIIYLWISELLLLNSEFLLACFCPVFSWSDNQGWLAGWLGGLRKRKNLWFISFEPVLLRRGNEVNWQAGKELRRNEIDRGWIPYTHCVVSVIHLVILHFGVSYFSHI